MGFFLQLKVKAFNQLLGKDLESFHSRPGTFLGSGDIS
jgi:hypothetical protein